MSWGAGEKAYLRGGSGEYGKQEWELVHIFTGWWKILNIPCFIFLNKSIYNATLKCFLLFHFLKTLCIFRAFSFLTHYDSWKIFAGCWRRAVTMAIATPRKCSVPSNCPPSVRPSELSGLWNLGYLGLNLDICPHMRPFLYQGRPQRPLGELLCKTSPGKVILYRGPWRQFWQRRRACS